MKYLISKLGLLCVLFIVPQYVDAELLDNRLSKILYKHQQKMQQLRLNQQENQSKFVELFWKNKDWQAGSNYVASSDWLALLCEGDNCFLQPSTLNVSEKSWQGRYDDEETAGQQLDFSLQNTSLQKTSTTKMIAQFKLNEHYPWLKAGSLDTYYSSSNNYQNKEYTFEIDVNLPQSKTARLVPLALSGNIRSDNINEKIRYYEGSYYLQLRAEGQRQLFLSLLGTCSEMLSNKYLQWSGDLDKDGQADYLISFVDHYGSVHLYLSSFAQEDEIVGIAGIYNTSSDEGDCYH